MTVDDATERLLRAHEYTNERGYATAEVVSEPYVEAGQIQVPIEVLTTGKRHTMAFDPPDTWSDEFQIVRLVESVGYGPGGITVLDGERFPVELASGSHGDDTTPKPVFTPDEARPSASSDAERPLISRASIGRGVTDAVRLAGQSARYALALVTFLSVVAIGTVVAATATYAIALGSVFALRALVIAGGSGLVGPLLPVLAVLVAIRVVVARQIRSRQSDEAAGNRRRTAASLDRYR